MKIPSFLAFALTAFAASAATAAAPSVTAIDAGFSFTAYAGAAAVGSGDVNIPSTLFYIDEKVADGWKSWYIFLDPGVSQNLVATLHFDQPIHTVLATRTELDASNAAYGAAGITYVTSRFIGLETCRIGRIYCDAVSWQAGSQDMSLDWSAIDPGDHVRVLVAVPEPKQHVLFAAGLIGLALGLRRRRGT